ncbi:hypothetical protein SAMN04487850_0375 [Prevotella aff. ruminicola Tc2-24]|uniref:Uncharacterized protein n=1 Tax=Prevotella aff. ruminicola Tc2-24 TaxID=81582 RepID=A0A1I0M6H6_9BACT|nr:hypothetical protein [Prevotella aff. ruminicola Tc2-24]SEV83953.1 hypothetical protein SAMN04487850_0375 [Prevotella aff. ruminicola Tc2-24]
MSLIRTWGNWMRSVFCLLFRRGSGRRENDLYVETLTEYLLQRSPLRPLSLSKGIPQGHGLVLRPALRQAQGPLSTRNAPGHRRWKGTVSSLTEAYTFLLNLPGVCLSRVECYMIADRLLYQVQINRQMEIIMREHTKGFDRWVCLTLLESKKPRLQIRLRLCEVETHELVSY